MAVAVTYNKCCVFNRFASETGTVIPGTAVVHLTAVSLVKPPCGGYRNKKWNCHLDPEAVEVKSPLRFLIFYDASTARNTQHATPALLLFVCLNNNKTGRSPPAAAILLFIRKAPHTNA
jgi:hypothetical protein